MIRDPWLDAHSYLRPLADLSAEVERAAAGIAVLDVRIPDWDDYRADFLAGVSLLSSADAALDLEPGGRMAAALLERLASGTSSGWLAAQARALETELRREPEIPRRIVDFLLGDETFTPPFPGLLRYLGWTSMARFLRPVVNGFSAWRDEERWLRRYCPTCGSLPAMAQLVGADPGRKRLLSCGCCGTRWQFKRTGCPFCDNRLAAAHEPDDRGRRRPAHRPLRVLRRLSQNLRRAGRRDAVALGLVVAASRSHRARSRTETAGRVAVRIRSGARFVAGTSQARSSAGVCPTRVTSNRKRGSRRRSAASLY